MRDLHSISRRHFLKSASALAATGPFILPSRVWAAATKPNDRITLAFIGTGIQSRHLINSLIKRNDTQVLAVCDVDTVRREDARKNVDKYYSEHDRKGECAGFNDFRDVLARRDIDAVVIATPDHWHALLATKAAADGKDIYCEKPLTQSIKEARAIVKAVRRHDRVFQTGSMQRSSKEFRKACELVRNGRLGKLQKIEVAIGGPGIWCDLPGQTPPEGLDWDLWLGPAPKRPYHEELSPRGLHKHFPNWRKYREYGGGMVTDWGAHHFDIAQWALGMDNSGPVEVIPPSDSKAESGVKLIYSNGVEVEHIPGNGVTFFGTEGKIYVNRGKFEATPTRLGDDPLPSKHVKLYVSDNHFEDWISCIRSRKRPICDVEIGARSVTVCHLTNLAYWHQQRIKWNPKREQFTGGTGDKSWLTVPYRDPWSLA